MKKRVVSMLLAVVMMLGMFPGTALAAGSVEEALGEVNIYNGEQKLSYLSINGRVRELIYTYYNYVDRNGQTKEIPAYCVNPNIKGVPQTVAPGESIKYLANEIGSDPKVIGIIANGYPHRSLSELKLENKYQAYYATKMALWAYLLPNWDINNMKVNPNLTGVELERANKMLAAVKDIYRRGTVWSTVLSPNVTVEADQETAYPATINGQEYLQQIFTVTSETWVCNYAVNVAFSDPSAVPAGTKIVDMDNKEIDVITTKATGKGYAGQFKVLYPASAVDGQSGSVQLSFRTNVYKYAIYYAVCAEKDKYGNLQNYMCDTDPTTPLALTAYSNYTDTPEEEPTETSMKILKYEEGTTIPLKGAMFEVVDPEGASVGTFATNSKGQIVIPLTLAGNYTVYEREAPNGYLLSEEPAQNVKVEYGKQATVTFENAPYGNLMVKKYSDYIRYPIVMEVEDYRQKEKPADAGDDSDDDDIDFALVNPDETIDLAEALQTSLIMETPFVVLCKPDCKGLCPVCGANLNEEDCGHAAQIEEARRPANPFAALADLKLDEEDGE